VDVVGGGCARMSKSGNMVVLRVLRYCKKCPMDARARLLDLHAELGHCRACPKMIPPVVHGPAVMSRIFLVGQAPGPHEGEIGKPFAWTAGKTLFRWLEDALEADEETVRKRIYISAVARCFPGKAKGGGDRRPDPDEIFRCRTYLEREMQILKRRLILPVGTLAIEQVLGHKGGLAEVVGKPLKVLFHGVAAEAIPLPHPSGASTWHKMEPGKTLLQKALLVLGAHPEVKRAFR
jgi:uracil-DNA glycosylase